MQGPGLRHGTFKTKKLLRNKTPIASFVNSSTLQSVTVMRHSKMKWSEAQGSDMRDSKVTLRVQANKPRALFLQTFLKQYSTAVNTVNDVSQRPPRKWANISLHITQARGSDTLASKQRNIKKENSNHELCEFLNATMGPRHATQQHEMKSGPGLWYERFKK